MRILFVSNLYPPVFVGGYEQLCYDVALRLQKKGHDIHVLTSNFGMRKNGIEEIEGMKVYRWLRLEKSYSYLSTNGKGWFRRITDAFLNRYNVQKVVGTVRPDVIYIWNMGYLERFLLHDLEKTGIPAAYHLSAPWLIWSDQWTGFWGYKPENAAKRVVKNILWSLVKKLNMEFKRERLNLDYVSCSCRSLFKWHLDSGIPLHKAQVIYEGIPLEIFPPPKGQNISSDSGNKIVSLLYAGQLGRHKGVHTAIEALDLLVNGKGVQNLRLTILGSGYEDYKRYLKYLVEEKGLSGYVSFRKALSRDKLSAEFLKHDIFIFPSIWQEPWSLTLLIAMACGLATVATIRGGSAELIEDGKNALFFEAENAHDLVDKIESLILSPELRRQLGSNAQKYVRENYSIERMVQNVELFLEEAVNGSYR